MNRFGGTPDKSRRVASESMVLTLIAMIPALASGVTVEWTQTARDGSTMTLLEDQKPLNMAASIGKPKGPAIIVDRSKKFQEFAGFGGAFTEATAINWRKLDAKHQEEVIKLYFSSPAEGGLGYTMGRVPINSCDFSPDSYTFDDVKGDTELKHFDTTVQHDVDNGMVPMIKAAQEAAKKRGQRLKLLASPWTAPAWMKVPVNGVQSMLISAKPNGLKAEMQRPWAKYFSKWIDAYTSHGVDVWGVTVQNEPEATAGWESMLWTPDFMASFVKVAQSLTLLPVPRQSPPRASPTLHETIASPRPVTPHSVTASHLCAYT